MLKNITAQRLAVLVIGMMMLITPAFADEPNGIRPGDSSAPISAADFIKLATSNDSLVSWRKRAENILKQDPKSCSGHALMGYIMYHCEGNLPRAKYHLQKCREYSKKRALRYKDQDASRYYGIASVVLIDVLGDMDLYQEKIDIINENKKPSPRMRVQKVWPLMKLNREKDARRELDIAFSSGDNDARITAWNSLGALESELGHYQAAYTAFQSLLAELAKNGKESQPVYYNNAGSAAWELGLYDEAEQYYLKAASCPFKDYYLSNPYRYLTEFYRQQGRFAEAFDAAKKMHRWSRANKPFLFQQSMAGNIEKSSRLLLDLGFVNEAADNLSVLVQRPDRCGATSASISEMEASNLISWRYALIIQEHMLEENMACTRKFSPEWWSLLYKRCLVNFNIKSSGERAASLIASNDKIKDWLRGCDDLTPLLIDILGTGVCAAAIHEIEKKPPENYKVIAPYHQALHGEINMRKGSYKKAKLNLENALRDLPKAEVLMRGRCQALLGKICDNSGLHADALKYYQTVLEKSPAMLRTLDCQLPVMVHGPSNATINKACEMIYKSPRFKKSSQGFRIDIALSGNELTATLSGPNGTVFAKASSPLEKSARKSAKNLVKELHRQVLSPKVSLTQIDINSLDGGNLSGSAASDSLNSIFSPQEPGERI